MRRAPRGCAVGPLPRRAPAQRPRCRPQPPPILILVLVLLALPLPLTAPAPRAQGTPRGKGGGGTRLRGLPTVEQVDKLLGGSDPMLVACAFRKQRLYLFTWVS